MRDEGIDPDNKELYQNNTFILLAPIANDYSQKITSALTGLTIRCWGVGDIDYSRVYNKIGLDSYFFILIDKYGQFLEDRGRYVNLKGSLKEFHMRMNVIKQSPDYVTDYVWDHKDSRHMIVMKIHKKYNNAFIRFLKGEYSKMFTEQELTLLSIKEEKGKKRLSIFTREKSFLPKFQEMVNSYYGTNVEIEDKGQELCLPFIPKREIFNWNKDFKFLIDNLLNSV